MPAPVTACVLDASAVLALLHEEPGHEVVGEIMDGAAISTVNLAEIVAKMRDRGLEVDRLLAAIRESLVDVVAFDAAMAIEAGILAAAGRRAGISLGDACCIALAKALAAPVYTADRAWAALDLGVEVRLIR